MRSLEHGLYIQCFRIQDPSAYGRGSIGCSVGLGLLNLIYLVRVYFVTLYPTRVKSSISVRNRRHMDVIILSTRCLVALAKRLSGHLSLHSTQELEGAYTVSFAMRNFA